MKVYFCFSICGKSSAANSATVASNLRQSQIWDQKWAQTVAHAAQWASGSLLFNYTTALPVPIRVAARSKVWVCRHSLAGITGWNPAGGMDVSLLWVLCCQVEVSASGWTLVQRSSTECGWVWSWSLDSGEALAHWGLPCHGRGGKLHFLRVKMP
jgi:hypothetical protein